LIALLLGCSGGGGSGGSSSSAVNDNDNAAQTPVMVVGDLDGSGTATAMLVDTSQPSGSRVLDAVTTDPSGNLIQTGSSSTAESAADSVAAGNVSDTPTTIPFGSSGTIVAQQGQ